MSASASVVPPGFDAFTAQVIDTPRGPVFARVGGSGPPLLLLHGYPQTHVMCHTVAPLVAVRHTVVAADLAGYGDSFRPAPAPDHAPHAKRALALDQTAAMSALGFERFAVAGHDRGGRVAYRMALDHPGRVERLAVLDIVPTGEVWWRADAAVARGYWHWTFLAQPAPLPEQMILGGPDAFFDLHVRGQLGLGAGGVPVPPELMALYRGLLDDPAGVEAMCEDYRAAATIDVEHDEADRAAGRRITCPTLALWGGRAGLPRFYEDPLEVWRPWAADLRGGPIDARHFLAEEAPEATAEALLEFLAA